MHCMGKQATDDMIYKSQTGEYDRTQHVIGECDMIKQGIRLTKRKYDRDIKTGNM